MATRHPAVRSSSARFLVLLLFLLVFLPTPTFCEFPIHDVGAAERVVYRAHGTLVTEGVDTVDLESNTVPAQRFRVLRFDKGPGKRHIESAVSCGPAPAAPSNGTAPAPLGTGVVPTGSKAVDICHKHPCSARLMGGRLLYSCK